MNKGEQVGLGIWELLESRYWVLRRVRTAMDRSLEYESRHSSKNVFNPLHHAFAVWPQYSQDRFNLLLLIPELISEFEKVKCNTSYIYFNYITIMH